MDQIMESQISKKIVSKTIWEDTADKVIILASEETDNRSLQAFCELSPDLEKLDEGTLLYTTSAWCMMSSSCTMMYIIYHRCQKYLCTYTTILLDARYKNQT